MMLLFGLILLMIGLAVWGFIPTLIIGAAAWMIVRNLPAMNLPDLNNSKNKKSYAE